MQLTQIKWLVVIGGQFFANDEALLHRTFLGHTRLNGEGTDINQAQHTGRDKVLVVGIFRRAVSIKQIIGILQVTFHWYTTEPRNFVFYLTSCSPCSNATSEDTIERNEDGEDDCYKKTEHTNDKITDIIH